jgi:RHS repeat-associated protein
VRVAHIYDAEGNILAVDGGSTASYQYNALNQRVETTVSGAPQNFVYNAAGQRVTIWNANTGAQTQGQYYWGGKRVAFYSGGSAHFQHQDWMGTERARTTYNGGVEGTFASLPFGDGLTTVSGTDLDAYHFATVDHDYEDETDHAQFRQYSEAQGHWFSPDPYGGSYDFSNPQSFNRYGYSLNNPLSAVDPSGLNACVPAGTGVRGGGGGMSPYCQAANFGSGDGVANALLGWLNTLQNTVPGGAIVTTPSGMRIPYTVGTDEFGNPVWVGQNGEEIDNPSEFGLPSLGINMIAVSIAQNAPAPSNGRQPNMITCGTVLPNGRTVGSYVNQLSNQINNSGSQSISTPYGPAPVYTPGLSPLSIPGAVYSGTNFRQMFGGPGANYAFLGDAGNFAYAAVSANIGVPLWATEAVAGGYSILAHPSSDWVGPWGMDPSATVQVPAGYGAGCKGY